MALEPNLFEGLWEGPIDNKASSIINAIADSPILIGESLEFVAPPAGEILPRVNNIRSIGRNILYGIGIGGDAGGTYPISAIGFGTGFDFSAIIAFGGQAVRVCTQGRCIARVKTQTNAINAGDLLTPNPTSELILATPGRPFVARALQSIPQIITLGAFQYMAVDIHREGKLPL